MGKTANLASIDICGLCAGTGRRPVYPRNGRLCTCNHCGGRGLVVSVRRGVLDVGYAIATRGEHIAVLAAAIALVPKLSMYPVAAPHLFAEIEAVLAHCDEDVAQRATAALIRLGCTRHATAAE